MYNSIQRTVPCFDVPTMNNNCLQRCWSHRVGVGGGGRGAGEGSGGGGSWGGGGSVHDLPKRETCDVYNFNTETLAREYGNKETCK